MTITSIDFFIILCSKLSDKEAEVLAEYDENKIEDSLMKDKETQVTKQYLQAELAELKAELMKSIYVVGLVKFLAITGCVVGILSFLLRK